MFAGGTDSESIFSLDRKPAASLQRSKSAVHPSSSRHHFNSNNPFLDPVEAAARVSLIEEEFGWSGSVGGIRGRDDRQIERDVEYERQMAERTRKRHERKLAKQQQILGTGGSNSTASDVKAERTIKRPVFAPTAHDLQQVDELTSAQIDSKPIQQVGANLNRGKSLRDKVEAALGRWNSVAIKKSSRSRSVSAIDAGAIHHDDDSPMVERKEGLGALARRISRKLTIEDQERRRRERLEMAYAEPPLLSHTLVGPASPFPMRPALSTLVPTGQVKYGEAHTEFSPNPFRRKPNANKEELIKRKPDLNKEDLAQTKTPRPKRESN